MKLGPYELNRIYTGDARELAKAIPDESVDLIVTDPPYFLPAQSYVGTRKAGYSKRSLADTSILYGFFSQVLTEAGRALRPSGSCYIFCDAQSYPIFYRAMFPHFKHVRLLIWDKIVSYNGYTWRHQHELIAWGERNDAMRIPTGDGDILRCRGVLQKDRLHAAEKPLGLIQRLIDKHKEARIVVDFFGGSGPVAVAATLLGRDYLVFELDESAAALARRRVAEAQPPLFVPQPEQAAMRLSA